MAATSTSRRKELSAHLRAAFNEIEQLAEQYRTAIEKLEAASVPNLTMDGATTWFRMYLRVVDVGVELRRGELRHRTSRSSSFPCMHTTGTKGARHSGLSIDDANALYQHLERAGLRESTLEAYFMRMDALDRDGVGLLDVRLNACLNEFVRRPSAFYRRLEVVGSDPHHELLVHTAGSPPIKATRDPATLTASTSADNEASDYVDAFRQNPIGTINVINNTLDDGSSDLGLAELKRQYGFEVSAPVDDEVDVSAGRSLSGGLPKRRRMVGAGAWPMTAPTEPLLSPRDIYRRKCQERGTPRKRKMDELFILRDGALELNLSQFGFHVAQELQDVLDVVTQAHHVPVRLLDVTNNFFDAQSFEIFCDLLRVPTLRLQLRTLVLRCLALPQRSDFATLLRILTDTDAGTLEALSTLNLSYNTFFEDAVLSLNDLLNGLGHLETLSLESCFPKAPDPGVVEVAVVKDLVRAALVTCCDRLKSLNFGSNWMSFPLLNAIFSPESALQELLITQMTFFYFDTAPETVPTGSVSSASSSVIPEQPLIPWTFGFQRQQRITLSETKNSRAEYLPFFLDALAASLNHDVVQLRHLDLWVLSPQQRRRSDAATGFAPASALQLDPLGSYATDMNLELDKRVIRLLDAIASYGKLEFLRLRYECDYAHTRGESQHTGNGNGVDQYTSSAVHQLRGGVSRVLQDGLAHCSSLELIVGVPLTIPDLCALLALVNAPSLRIFKISIALLTTPPESDASSTNTDAITSAQLARVFQTVLATLSELTLEFHVPLHGSRDRTLLPDRVVQAMEHAWCALPCPAGQRRHVTLVQRKHRKERVSPASSASAAVSEARHIAALATFALQFTTPSS